MITKNLSESICIILNALCYALSQTIYSHIDVIGYASTDTDTTEQINALVKEIKFIIEENHLTADDLEHVLRYEDFLLEYGTDA